MDIPEETPAPETTAPPALKCSDFRGKNCVKLAKKKKVENCFKNKVKGKWVCTDEPPATPEPTQKPTCAEIKGKKPCKQADCSFAKGKCSDPPPPTPCAEMSTKQCKSKKHRGRCRVVK